MTILRIIGYTLVAAGVLAACLYVGMILYFGSLLEGRF